MINISDKFTAKTMDGIVADSHQIQYEQGKTTQRGDTVADKITELEGKIGTVQTDLDGYVKYQQQTKTEGEKQTARDNIGAASTETVQALKDKDTALDGEIASLKEKDEAHDTSITALQEKGTAIDGEISSIKTSTESMEKAVVNSLFELKTNTYTKAESDGKYAISSASYTKTESDEKYALSGASYTKVESDEKYALKTDSYTKTESDGKYALSGSSYTKTESDDRYSLKTDSYTKAESNKLYPLKKDVYDKQYMDEKFKVISSGLNDFDERSNSFATKADVPYRFVKMSQSEYDNLAQKDENTIYIIL